MIDQKGCPGLPISCWVGELDIDDPKFSGDVRNSHNHYTTTLMVTCPRVGLVKKSSSCKRNDNTSKNEEATIWILLKLGSHKPMNGENVSTV
jgi:hypothetical protein